MKIPRSGPIWFLICGIPAFAVAVIGALASMVCWDWLNDKCIDWFEELWGGVMSTLKQTTCRPVLFRVAWLLNKLRALVGQTITIQRLADEFEVSRKCIDRDLEMLRNIGALETTSSRDGVKMDSRQGLLILNVVCPFCLKDHPISPEHA